MIAGVFQAMCCGDSGDRTLQVEGWAPPPRIAGFSVQTPRGATRSRHRGGSGQGAEAWEEIMS